MSLIGVDQARILVIDDQADNVRLLERILGGAYANVKGLTEPGRALETMAEFKPDLLLLDLRMPRVSGFTILEQLRQSSPTNDSVPVIVLTADSTTEARNRALHLGAHDFLTNPPDRHEVLLRVRNNLQISMLHLHLKYQNH